MIVTDNELPAITCPATATLSADAGQCSSSAAIGLATATDNCSGVLVSGPMPAGPYAIGTTTVTWTATDAAGNISTCTQDVVVTDDESPVITCPATANLSADAGQCSSSASIGVATATDNCAGVVVSGPMPAGPYTIGTTTVTWTATDAAGNISTCTQDVVVTDDEFPALVAPAAIFVCDGETVTYAAPVGTDNCAVTTTQTDGSGLTDGDIFPVGTTTLEYTAEDASGNQTVVTFDVTVRPLPSVSIVQSESPEYCQGGAIVLTADAPDAVSYSWSNGDAAATTNVYASGTYTLTITNGFGCQNTASIVVNYVAQNLLSAYTILATEDVHLHGNTTVLNGGVGVLDANKSAKIHDNSTITAATTFVMAPVIDVKSGALVTTQIIGQPSVSLPTFLYATVGNTDVTVPDNTTMILSGASYKKVEVKKNATAIFTQQDVSVKELKTKEGATIKFSACTYLRIEKKLDLDKDNSFNPDGYKVSVFIEDEKADIKEGTTFNGSIYALDEEIKVKGKNTSPSYMNGMFIGKKVKGEKFVTWNWNTNCDINCPIVPPNKTSPADIAEENDLALRVIAYPSPFSNTFNVEITSDFDGNVDIALFDLNGKLLESYKNIDPAYAPTLGEGLPEGMYFVYVTQNGITKVVKVSKVY